MQPDITQCPYCNSNNLGIGYQLGEGSLFADEYAYHTSYASSPVVSIICKECGSILRSRVTKPELFRQSGLIRQDELLDYINQHGILLCNLSKDLPSLCSLGYSWENVTGLIDLHEIFYCKAYKKRSTYLSREAYLLLRMCRTKKPMDENAKMVYEALETLEKAEKDQLRERLGMAAKDLDKSMDFLLENLYITAFSNGKYLSPSFSTFVYSTAKRWEKEVAKLHFRGDPKPRLAELLQKDMTEKDFIKLAE